MSVESPEALERSVLESKDREQLLAIAAAIGVKATSRAKKAEIIDKILTQTGHEDQASGSAPETPRPRANGRAKTAKSVESVETVAEAPAVVAEASAAEVETPPADVAAGTDNEPPAEWEMAVTVDDEESIDEDDDDDEEDGPSDLSVQDVPFEEPGVPGSGQPDPFGRAVALAASARRKNATATPMAPGN
jgi:transcription termination factor Rho